MKYFAQYIMTVLMSEWLLSKLITMLTLTLHMHDGHFHLYYIFLPSIYLHVCFHILNYFVSRYWNCASYWDIYQYISCRYKYWFVSITHHHPNQPQKFSVLYRLHMIFIKIVCSLPIFSKIKFQIVSLRMSILI